MKIPRKNRFLFPYTGKSPKYFVTVESRKGNSFHLADPRVTRLALALMGMQAGLGGAASHWGGPSAFAEICSALYGIIFHFAQLKGVQWHEMFHIINDAGHCENGIYALKANYGLGDLNFQHLKGFRSIDSVLTGHGEANLFPEGVYLSNGPLGSTVAQAQGLCMADRIENLDRKTVILMSDGACMEGEVKEAFSSVAGFTQKQKMNPFIVIVSDNNTKLSGRIDRDSFSMDSFFNSLKVLGWEIVELPKAHNLKSCVDAIEELLVRPIENFSKPVFVRAKTIKGYGVKITEKALHGGHGFPLKDPELLPAFLEEIYGSKQIPDEFMEWCNELNNKEPEKTLINKTTLQKANKGQTKKRDINTIVSSKRVKVQEGISNALIRAREKGLPIISISADLQGSTGVLPFRKQFPECSFDVGVAEANMVSIAAGFSKQGFIPIVDTFAQFGVTKGALPLFMANLSEAPIIAIFSHTGFQDAADGASHQTLTYLAQTMALPLTKIYCLTSAEEAVSLVFQAIETFSLARKKGMIPETHIFFLGREIFSPSYLPGDYPYQLGKAQIVYSHGTSETKQGVSIIVCGPLLEEGIKAARKLTDMSWNVEVINPSIINYLDMETILFSLKKNQFRLLTVEDHHLVGGMGSVMAHQLMLKGVKVDMCSLAVRSHFGRSAYKSIDLYEKEKLSAESIVQTILDKWGE